MTTPSTAPHGAHTALLSADDVARGGRTISFPQVVGDEVWWQELRPEEGGRVTVMHRAPDGTVTDLLTAPWRAQTRVHEYGGRSYLPVPRRDDKAITRYGIVFANFADQRLYLLGKGDTEPRPITPEPHAPRAMRFADLTLAPDGKHVICVLERHEPTNPASEPDQAATAEQPDHSNPAAPTTEPDAADATATGSDATAPTDAPHTPASDTEDTEDTAATVRRSIVAIPLSGRAVTKPDAITELVSGADFYAAPAPSPDGAHLAWISWDHPHMPWDGTDLRIGQFGNDGTIVATRHFKGSPTESVLAPVWRDATTLCCVSDWSGWWNLYEIPLDGPAMAAYPAEEEFAHPPWALGVTPFTPLDDGRLVVLHGNADLDLAICDPDAGTLDPVSSPLSSWQMVSGDGTSVVGVAAAPDTPVSLARFHPASGRVEVLRREREDIPATLPLPRPRPETVTSRFGTVHATVYPPTGPDGAATGPVPFVVWVHGGPTGAARTILDLEKAYFTSRGIGVLDVNYGGSAGYGRTYRQRLHYEWGSLDVEDATAAARALVDAGVADSGRLAIRGASAGGLTTLLALTGDTFACGVSLFGVTDLLRLAEQTHDFESRYLDTLIGPLPGYAATFAERSPINRAAEIDVPVLLLQGDQDPVVPPEQAAAFAATLTERGVPHAHIEFAGEAHGFRAAETRRRALEAELAFYGRVFGLPTPGVPALELVTATAAEDAKEDVRT